MAKRQLDSINFRADLISLAKKQIEFLAFIDAEKKFYGGELLAKAIYRYERYWLPLCAQLEDSGLDLKRYYPPNDVAWVWHCHMLCPTAYIADCKAVCGRVIDHSCYGVYGIRDRQRETQELWESKLNGVPFDYQSARSVGLNNETDYRSFRSSRITYDLKAASERQKGFYYQVSLPHFENEEFLKLCVNRYKKFLLVKKLNPEQFVVPCYGIDLIWHTHQLCPRMYAEDTRQLLGYVFPHDDSVNDRSAGSKLNTSGDQTRQLWRETFDGEEFFCPGAMYRGDKPDKPHFFPNSLFDYSLFFIKTGSINLAENRLICTRNVKHGEKSKFHMLVTLNKRTIYEGVLSCRDVLRFANSFRFDQLDERTLDLRVWLIVKEGLSDKLLGVFKISSSSSNTGKKNSSGGGSGGNNKETYFDPKLIVPAGGVEYQNFAYQLKDTHSNEFTVDQKWKIESFDEKAVGFELVQQPFKSVHMLDVLGEYEAFNLKNRNLSGERGKSIRAQHIVGSTMNNERVSLFTAEILHIVSLQWSSVKIALETRLLATAHLIGLSQLPTIEQISNEPSSCIIFDPKLERAMLVRNLRGDYAVVIGKWVGMRRGIPPKSRGMRGVPGDPGRLQVTIHFLETKTSINMQISLNAQFQFESSQTKMTADLKTGKIQAKFLNAVTQHRDLEIESNLAIIFAISVLHVVLQPKPTPYLDSKPDKRISPRINPYYLGGGGVVGSSSAYRGSRPIRSVPLTSYVMLSSIGYTDLICSPTFYHHYCDSYYHHHDHNHNHNDCHHHNHNDSTSSNNNDVFVPGGEHEHNHDGHGDNCGEEYGDTNGAGGNSWFPDSSSGGNEGGGGGGGHSGDSGNSSGGGGGGSGDTSGWDNTGCGGCGGSGAGGGGCGSGGGSGGGGGSSCGGGYSGGGGGGDSGGGGGGGGGGGASCGGGGDSGGGGGGGSSCGGGGGGGASCGGGGGGSSCGGGGCGGGGGGGGD